jgi:hypothetical protein
LDVTDFPVWLGHFQRSSRLTRKRKTSRLKGYMMGANEMVSYTCHANKYSMAARNLLGLMPA